MVHPLEGAQAWLDRAEEHLRDLTTLCGSIAERECDAMIGTVRVESKPGKPASYAFTKPTAIVPARLSILVGEAIQAMRRSLDYLVYEIAWLDSGSEKKGTQFPIEDSSRLFERRRQPRSSRDDSCYLNGVSDKHAATIKRLQPFPRPNWTKTLRSISNPDKHRHLIVAKNQARATVQGWAHGAANGQTERVAPDAFTFLLHTGDGNTPDNMYLKFHVTAYVAFEDRVRVVELLDQLKTEVTNVLRISSRASVVSAITDHPQRLHRPLVVPQLRQTKG